MFIGLGGIAAHAAKAARPLVIPLCPHRMRTVFNDGDTGRIANLHQALHITDMPAHMAEHQNLGLICLGFQIRQIDHQIFGHTDKNRPRAHRSDRAGHRRKGKRVGQNRIARPNLQSAQSCGQSIPARGHRQTVGRVNRSSKFLLQKRHFAQLALSHIVAVQPPGSKHRNSSVYRILRDRLLLCKLARKSFTHAALMRQSSHEVNDFCVTYAPS